MQALASLDLVAFERLREREKDIEDRPRLKRAGLRSWIQRSSAGRLETSGSQRVLHPEGCRSRFARELYENVATL